ncbi:putative aBC transporter [Mycobacterium kansasii 662]|uniref:Putative aBC transporter n=1 Tax=Mycobacterium kansasii 662 TaxID=1299326 RepID=X7XWM0_MYCKA|nr:putative aBC transporter [Mycobacterium kansasii 662]
MAVVAVTVVSMIIGLLISALIGNADRGMPLLVLVGHGPTGAVRRNVRGERPASARATGLAVPVPVDLRHGRRTPSG